MPKKQILIVDDDGSFAELLRTNLEGTDAYAVDWAATALEGTEKVRGKNYDLIFLDVLMPIIEGGEALTLIRNLTKAPVVIMSSYLPPDKESRILKAGAAAFVRKPFNLKDTLQVMRQAFNAQGKETAKHSQNSPGS